VSPFTQRIARRRALAYREAEAKKLANMKARTVADPHNAKVSENDDPCPAWIMRAARGEQLPGDPGTDSEGQSFIAVEKWQADVLPLVERLQSGPFCSKDIENLLPVPFKLQPCVTITEVTVWLESIRREVLRGPSGPRARLGVLQEDLRFLALRMRGDSTEEELETAGCGSTFG